MKILVLLTAILLTGNVLAAMKSECYGREYTNEHMRANPGQLVKDIRVELFSYDYGPIYSRIWAKTRRSINGSVSFYNDGTCDIYYRPNGLHVIDCSLVNSAGDFVIRSDARSGLLTHSGIVLQDATQEGHGGELYLRPNSDDNTFRLYPLPYAECL